MGSHTERDEFTAALLEQVDTIRQIGRKRLHDRTLLDDFTQETLARAYDAKDGLRDASCLPNWVASIALNLARRWSRPSPVSAVEHVPERCPEFIEGTPSPEPSPLERMEGMERRQALLDALDCLGPSERALILSHYLDGESCAELAERHRLSRSAVKVRLHRARRKLWQRLAGWAASLVVVGKIRGAAGGILIMKIGTKIGIVAAALGLALTVAVAVRQAGFETRPDVNETAAVAKSNPTETSRAQETAASKETAKTTPLKSASVESPTPVTGNALRKPSGVAAEKAAVGEVSALSKSSDSKDARGRTEVQEARPMTRSLTPEQLRVYNALQEMVFLQRALIMTVQELSRSGPFMPPKPGPNATEAEISAWETEARQKQREIAAKLDPIRQTLRSKENEVRSLVPQAYDVQTGPDTERVNVNGAKLREAAGGRLPAEDLGLGEISGKLDIDGPDGILRIEARHGPNGFGIGIEDIRQ